MRNLKRFMACLLAATMMCTSLVGCGGGSSSDTAAEDTTKEEAPAEEAPAEEAPAEDTAEEAEAPSEEDSGINAEVEALIGGKGDGMKVGIAVSDLSSTYIVAAAEYAKKLFEFSGAEVTLVNAEQNANTQASQVDDFISAGCNVILLHAADSDALAASVDKATEAGVKVVGFNKEISSDNLTFAVVSSDNVATGASAAQWLADKAKEENVENPKIAVIQGTMTQSDAYLRQDGINEVAEKEGLVLLEEPCEWLSDKAESAMSDVLTANPDLFGVITHCDSMDQGVISALRQNGLDGAAGSDNHVYWSGIDGDATGLESLDSGFMDVAVEQNPMALSTVIVKGVFEYLMNDVDLEGEIIPIETKVLTAADTADETRWASYNTDSDTLWAGTVEAWEHYLNK